MVQLIEISLYLSLSYLMIFLISIRLPIACLPKGLYKNGNKCAYKKLILIKYNELLANGLPAFGLHGLLN